MKLPFVLFTDDIDDEQVTDPDLVATTCGKFHVTPSGVTVWVRETTNLQKLRVVLCWYSTWQANEVLDPPDAVTGGALAEGEIVAAKGVLRVATHGSDTLVAAVDQLFVTLITTTGLAIAAPADTIVMNRAAMLAVHFEVAKTSLIELSNVGACEREPKRRVGICQRVSSPFGREA